MPTWRPRSEKNLGQRSYPQMNVALMLQTINWLLLVLLTRANRKDKDVVKHVLLHSQVHNILPS